MKIPELRVVIKKYAVDIVLLQETKFDLEDPTPLLEGFDAIRTDRKGSGTHTRRGGGLITYIKKDLQYSVPQCPAVSPLEQQCILLPTSSGRSISITNVYIPQKSSTQTRDLSKLVASLPSAQGLICGDFNAHHPAWDDVARSDERGTALFQWAEDNSKLVLNDGTPTRASRNNQGPGFSSPDITLVDADAANSFNWSVLNELNSDHFLVLIKWNQGVGYENQKTKTRSNYHKASRTRFQEIVMEALTELAAEEVPSRKLFIFTEALKKAALMTRPLRVLRTNETPYMNDEIKCLMKESNQLRRNMASNRTAWLQKCNEVAEKVEEAKRMSWRNNLEKIKAGKDARLAWRRVRGLKNNEQQPTRKALQYRGRLHHRDQAKAKAFIQKYANVNSRTSDRVGRLAVKQH